MYMYSTDLTKLEPS